MACDWQLVTGGLCTAAYLLWCRAAILTVVLDTKVLVDATGVMRSRQDEGPECLEPPCMNNGGRGAGGQVRGGGFQGCAREASFEGAREREV